MRTLAMRLRGAVVPLALLLLAEAGMRAAGTQSDALARPSEVALALGEALGDGSLLRASAQTLGAGGAGLLVGGGLGLAAGLWFGLSPLAGRLSALTVELLKPVPSVALIPIAMLLFGFGYRMEILVVAFTCFFPMLMLSQAAVAGVEPRLLEMGTVIGLTRRQRVWKIVLPAALPRILVGFRLAVGIALVVAVTVEIAANPYGLGYGLMIAQQSLRPDLMFAFLFWIGALGWGLNALMVALQRRCITPFNQGAAS
ncbi:ABC transporter permease [Pseudoduganella namucuonensis]|uniref:NitT/TauT family transport system permease protein n=1 Tax=Pseudoduganella namucuonensis TaxID=1035707 RepID=A0A1I7L7C2_9BURK|nr:ABC transporter permease subunit [Pseudoduganella namucuonensis]SFV05545.1 NitT/TauT family transport system permease protein [Pseudoduganella namucuonensis]